MLGGKKHNKLNTDRNYSTQCERVLASLDNSNHVFLYMTVFCSVNFLIPSLYNVFACALSLY
jgi:hypothetical protein